MAKIGVFDSGVGGLSVLREIVKLLPGESYVYFSDNAYCPYGEKEQSFIIDRAREITDWMLFKGVNIIVVACNTATAAAIATLREEYASPSERVSRLTQGRTDHIKFIGMEPAVKLATALTRSGVVGVLATAGTLAGEKYKDNKIRWEGNTRIEEHVGEGFVELVESGETSGPHAEEVVRASLQPLLDAGADTIVLGCTHYPFLREVIQGIAGPDVQVIDPAPAVARQLLRVIREEGIALSGATNDSAGGSAPDANAPAGDFLFQSSGPRDALDRLSHALFTLKR
ncbi:MAG: glutamate racemase [Bacteroidales bacterium]|nr:glutamate racemase [Bacteroidales bacterium]